MQNPPGPPGPPPPGPQGPPPAMAGTGMDKKTAALLSYLVTWITGIIFLFVGKNDPDVKYHAAQSIVFFGGISIIEILVNIVTSISSALGFLSWLNFLLNIVILVGWIYCLYKAWTGNGARFEIPVIGSIITPNAEMLAARVNP
jgi:uncharacterized membrane protein